MNQETWMMKWSTRAQWLERQERMILQHTCTLSKQTEREHRWPMHTSAQPSNPFLACPSKELSTWTAMYKKP